MIINNDGLVYEGEKIKNTGKLFIEFSSLWEWWHEKKVLIAIYRKNSVTVNYIIYIKKTWILFPS